MWSGSTNIYRNRCGLVVGKLYVQGESGYLVTTYQHGNKFLSVKSVNFFNK